MQRLGSARFGRSTLPRLGQILLISWLLLLGGIELLGRRTGSDLFEACGWLLVGVACVITGAVHAAQPQYPLVVARKRLSRRINRLLESLRNYGIDFRDSPAYPTRVPAGWSTLLTVCGAAVLVGAVVSPWMPGLARGWLADRVYLVWLAIWGVLMIGSLASIALYSFLIWGGVHDQFVERQKPAHPRPMEGEFATLTGIAIAVILSAYWLSPAIAMVALAGLVVVHTAAVLVSGPGMTLSWRHRSTGVLYRLDGRWMLWIQWIAPWAATTALLLMTTPSDQHSTSAMAETPLLTAVGRLHAWVAVAGSVVITLLSVRYTCLANWGNPARGPNHEPSFDMPPEIRRGEIIARRKIIKGLERLFKRAASSRGDTGTGYWIGLQHWYILGLSRDEEVAGVIHRDETVFDRIIGLPFYRVIPQSARHHYWQMLQSLEIDLMFVEKGVPFRRLTRVFRTIFELYDVHGGRQRAEERFFTGLPGIRVVLHDYDTVESPSHQLTKYPEADYDDISRARILHIFKDRGADEVEDFVPDNWEGQPLFSGT
ncbi:MAG: hypothetical protein KF777_05030 [Planctomycetaceae bacterium]|nr:hypothetical protein [Planctomycetaceae bacterium]